MMLFKPILFVCKIPLLERAVDRPSARDDRVSCIQLFCGLLIIFFTLF